MISNFRIIPFNDYVLRTPLLPLSIYYDTLDNYSSEKTKQLYQKPLIREAIKLASPDLIKQLDKWANNDPHLSKEKSKKLELTFVKYLARMSSRCTPFGLFAGCSLGRIAIKTDIILGDAESFQRYTQFDMYFWIALLENIANRREIIEHLKYYPNNSIYKIGDFYRYIEYKTIGRKREHSITALRKSKALKDLINNAKKGATIQEIVELLADDANEKKGAQEFILKLIDYQFLTSELDIVLTGNNEWERVLSILRKIPSLEKEYQILKKIQKQVAALDEELIASEKKYNQIKNEIRETGISYEEKYLFQTDLNVITTANSLHANVSKKVLSALYFLNGIQGKSSSENLEQFKKAFITRYESRSMPLAVVLDTEIGIGYIQNLQMNDIHEALEYLSITSKKQGKNELWTSYDLVLQKKIQQCSQKNETTIILKEKDFDNFNNDLTDLPATFSVMIEVLKEDNIIIESSGNVSAAKLLGRFCNGNSAIHNLVKDIITKEENYFKDKIMAEVVHVPESRTGNILRRPTLRNYEISYLAKSGVTENNTINLNDLFISIKNDTIVLKSKKYNKEIIPCLSNAHNFSKDSLPIYHFLCDLQLQYSRPVYSFSWGNLENHYDFFPRVIFRDIILSKAKWIIKKEEIQGFQEMSDQKIFNNFTLWKSSRKIPRYVNWTNGDNTLLLDFESQIGVELFLNAVQNRDKITLEEFLFTEESVVKNKNEDHFCNQFILSFYKE